MPIETYALEDCDPIGDCFNCGENPTEVAVIEDSEEVQRVLGMKRLRVLYCSICAEDFINEIRCAAEHGDIDVMIADRRRDRA